MKSVALPIPSFTLAQLVDNNYKDNVMCSSCKEAVQKPVEVLPSKCLYCCNCALSLAFSSSFTCSSCSCIHESIDSTFTKPSSIVEKMINGLYVRCNICGINVKVELLEADCHTHKKSHKKELNKAMSELLPQSHQIITVSTGGRPISLTKVSSPSVPSDKASQRTLRRRTWSINMSSEKKQREAMKKDLEAVKITAESVPFSFLTRHDCQEIHLAPLACVTDFASVVFHLLEEKNRLGQLTWHDGVIPPNEI
uniref:Uncharacterized protein n=1 Tax=Amphimedon queenslandica TaxID=400682 RepID=A0A1X7TX35_AMPQE